MTGSEQRIFEARMDSLPLAMAFVETVCELHAVAPPDALRMTLIVEELFTNTIVHGHGGGAESPVRIEVAIEQAQVTLRYQDSAPPFDPLQYLREAQPDLDVPVGERRLGGLGLPLVARMAEEFDYAHVGGYNCLELVLRRHAP